MKPTITILPPPAEAARVILEMSVPEARLVSALLGRCRGTPETSLLYGVLANNIPGGPGRLWNHERIALIEPDLV